VNDQRFLKYAKIFGEHGFHLYMVGGTARDYLLEQPYTDFDFVTDAKPDDMRKFLPDARYDFARFGSIKIFEDGVEIDITTLRKEGEYVDHRHPSKIEFITDPKEDSWRRDFTINAIYIDRDDHIYDFHGGLSDLEKGIIRFIGDPEKRIEEDPLRMLRAKRFAKRLGFTIDPQSEKAMNDLALLLGKLNPEKVMMESKKE
jgi:tRNA nucleotidyltransferase (CCA-adding enzyme)